jgi:AmmeMemoRadiSam system protein A
MEDVAPARSVAVGTPPALDAADRQWLLALARETVEMVVRGMPPPSPEESALAAVLRAPRSAFVTIRERTGELRGCIGNLDDAEETWRNVRAAARGAAIRDPRFPPVAEWELDGLVIDVSVLGDPVDLPDPALFDPVVHGVIVDRDGRRALLLPDVGPPLGWDAERTLDAVCEKAGLPADAWRRRGTHLRVFATTEFHEDHGPA